MSILTLLKCTFTHMQTNIHNSNPRPPIFHGHTLYTNTHEHMHSLFTNANTRHTLKEQVYIHIHALLTPPHMLSHAHSQKAHAYTNIHALFRHITKSQTHTLLQIFSTTGAAELFLFSPKHVSRDRSA